LDREALRADFLGAWRGIEQRLSKARIDALLQKSRTGSLTNEDKALYRQLMRGGGTVDQAPLT
jgi:hypothetical protein